MISQVAASWGPLEGYDEPNMWEEGAQQQPVEPQVEESAVAAPFFVVEVKPHEPPPVMDETALAAANVVAEEAANAALAAEEPRGTSNPNRRRSAHSKSPHIRSASLSPRGRGPNGKKNGKKVDEKAEKKERSQSARRKSTTCAVVAPAGVVGQLDKNAMRWLWVLPQQRDCASGKSLY